MCGKSPVGGVGDKVEVSKPSRNFNPLSNGAFREDQGACSGGVRWDKEKR